MRGMRTAKHGKHGYELGMSSLTLAAWSCAILTAWAKMPHTSIVTFGKNFHLYTGAKAICRRETGETGVNSAAKREVTFSHE